VQLMPHTEAITQAAKKVRSPAQRGPQTVKAVIGF
jgi:hypothetical protein